MTDDVVPTAAIEAGFTDVELAGWLIIGTALRRHAEQGATVAAVPHHLLRLLRVPAYPLDHLAPAVDLDGRHCGLDGFHRDDLAGVDWWCLLPAGHDDRHAWELAAPLILDAVAQGHRPELDDAGDELAEWAADELAR